MDFINIALGVVVGNLISALIIGVAYVVIRDGEEDAKRASAGMDFWRD